MTLNPWRVLLLALVVVAGGAASAAQPRNAGPFRMAVFFNNAPITSTSIGQGNNKSVEASEMFFRAWGYPVPGRDVTRQAIWTSLDPTIATVANGVISGVNPGSTTITATHGSRQASVTVTVTAPPALVSIAVTPQYPSVAEGGSVQFTATGTYADSSTRDLTNTATWGSSVIAVATISNTGLASALANGTTTISATQTSISGSTVLSVAATATFYSLPANRVTLWQPGVTYNGGIPTNRTQCGATVTPSGDTSGATDTVTVQNAINACTGGHYVLLAPGTFYVNGASQPTNPNGGLWIGTSNITLRGSGAGVTTGGTVIVQSNPTTSFYPVITVGWHNSEWPEASGCQGQSNCTDPVVGSIPALAGIIPLVADAAKETNTVQVNASMVAALSPALAIGEIVDLTEQYDANLVWYDFPNLLNSGGEDQCSGSGFCGMGEDWADNFLGKNEYLVSRPVGQANLITGISTHSGTTTITFAAPWHTNFRVAFAADLARVFPNQPGIGDPGPAVTGVGIENLSVGNANGGDDAANIYFDTVANSWVKNVESFNSNGGNIDLVNSFRCEVRDSYLHTAGNPNPGGGGYGMEFNTYTADSLFENNIAWSFNKVMAMRSTGGGNVIGYNYFEDAYGQGYPTIVEVGINASHMAGTHYELFEGNQGFNLDSDSGWGTQTYITAFRNHLTTLRRNIGNGSGTTQVDVPSYCSGAFSCSGPVVALSDVDNRRGIGLSVHQWWYSYVGNVIGYPSNYLQSPAIGYAYPATFSPQPASSSWIYEWTGVNNGGAQPGSAAIWQLGYDGSNWLATPDQPTTETNANPSAFPSGTQTVLNTILRDGNFDYYTGLTHWHGIGQNLCTNGATCTGQYITPPANATLPASLYIPANMQPPAFFKGKTWPWVDGTNAANPLPGALPARTRFDAGTPNVVP
jgi:hypothetical protein